MKLFITLLKLSEVCRAKHAGLLLFSAIGCILSCIALASSKALFEPADGKTLLFIGQEKGEIASYWEQVGPAAGYMLYTNLSSLEGMDSAHQGKGCSDSGVMSYEDWLQNYPNTAVQIGLYMVGQLPDVISGDLDILIEELAEKLRASDRPVFLRIGYEFDGPWNRYDSDLYKRAYRRLVRIFRGEKLAEMPAAIKPVANVAFVWHSAAYNRYQNKPLHAWYPGDEYVDWIGLSWFHWGNSNDNAAADQARDEVVRFADQRSKPLMIAEAAPKRYFEADKSDAWQGWHQPVLEWIAANNVKAYSYINQNWNTMPQWRDAFCGNGADWGDTRIQKPDSKILKTWQEAVQSDRYLLQGEGLLRAINFKKNEE